MVHSHQKHLQKGRPHSPKFHCAPPQVRHQIYRTSINIVCCGVVHHCPHTAHIHDDKLVTCNKDVSEHYRDFAMGTVVPMSKVEGSWTWLSYNTYLHVSCLIVIHARMRITGRFKGYFPVHMASYRMKVVSSLAVRFHLCLVHVTSLSSCMIMYNMLCVGAVMHYSTTHVQY